jgi:hypothetical protein
MTLALLMSGKRATVIRMRASEQDGRLAVYEKVSGSMPVKRAIEVARRLDARNNIVRQMTVEDAIAVDRAERTQALMA